MAMPGYYASGIDANPLMTGAQQQTHLDRFANAGGGAFPMGQFPTLGASPDAKSQLLDQLRQSTVNANQRASLDWQRRFANANTSHLLSSEGARANAGIAGGNYLQNSDQQAMQQQMGQRNMLLSFLAPYLNQAMG